MDSFLEISDIQEIGQEIAFYIHIHFIKIFNSQDPEEVVAMTPPVESVTELTNGDVEDVTDKTALIQPHRE